MTDSGSSIRHAAHPIDTFFLDRWSPRSFVAEAMPEEDLLALCEAARWAPSSYNNQPWRFLYARRDSASWPLFFNLLEEGNRSWASHAAVLLLVISNTKFDHNGKECFTHSFDAGAAWQNLALQAWLKGYAAHAMQGFDYKRAQKELEVPSDFHVDAMIAIGRPGPREGAPAAFQEKEKPNERRPLADSMVEGTFQNSLVHSEKKS
jgi:nitroreductase